MVKKFYDLAKEFCDFVTEKELQEGDLDLLMSLILRLYANGLSLPDMEPETDNVADDVKLPQMCIRISQDIPSSYWEVFNPLEEDAPVCGSLYDDLRDIARDLQVGISEYEAGKIGNAVFEWSFGLNNHWGQHAVDIIKTLHSLRTR